MALVFTLFFPAALVQSAIYEYRDETGRRIFTSACNEEQLKAGCKKVTLQERSPLSPEEKQNLTTLFPKGDQAEGLIKEAREGPKKGSHQTALRADMNGDGKVTISDLPGYLQW